MSDQGNIVFEHSSRQVSSKKQHFINISIILSSYRLICCPVSLISTSCSALIPVSLRSISSLTAAILNFSVLSPSSTLQNDLVLDWKSQQMLARKSRRLLPRVLHSIQSQRRKTICQQSWCSRAY